MRSTLSLITSVAILALVVVPTHAGILPPENGVATVVPPTNQTVAPAQLERVPTVDSEQALVLASNNVPTLLRAAKAEEPSKSEELPFLMVNNPALPEPASIALLLVGAGLMLSNRRGWRPGN